MGYASRNKIANMDSITHNGEVHNVVTFNKAGLENAIKLDDVNATIKVLSDSNAETKNMAAWMKLSASMLKPGGICVLVGN